MWVLLSRLRDSVSSSYEEVNNVWKKIEEVSKLSGVSKRTLQYYDDEGILPVKRSNPCLCKIPSCFMYETEE